MALKIWMAAQLERDRREYDECTRAADGLAIANNLLLKGDPDNSHTHSLTRPDTTIETPN